MNCDNLHFQKEQENDPSMRHRCFVQSQNCILQWFIYNTKLFIPNSAIKLNNFHERRIQKENSNPSIGKFHFSENELFKSLVQNYMEEIFTDKIINMKFMEN